MVRRIAALSTVALAAAAAGVAVPAGAQTATTLTLTEPAGGTFNIVDNAPKSHGQGEHQRFSVGDSLVISNKILDASRKRVGKVQAVCFVNKAGTFATATSDCVGVFKLAGGNLYVSIPLQFSSTKETGAVVGGTGAYQGLHGTWTTVNHRDDSSTDTFTLTP
jgi:hypothetical protein